MALENRQAKGPRLSSIPGSSRVVSPVASGSALKYTPYDPLEIIPRLRRTSRPSSSQSSHSGLSDPGQVSLHTSLPMTSEKLTLAGGLEFKRVTNVILNLVDYTKRLLTFIFIATSFSCRCSSKLGTIGFTGESYYYMI